MGIAAITDFRVLRQDAPGEENIWPDPNIEEGRIWTMRGAAAVLASAAASAQRMAHVLKLPPPAKGHALVIADDDLHLSATWQADLPLRDKAQGGDTLTLEWRELFPWALGA